MLIIRAVYVYIVFYILVSIANTNHVLAQNALPPTVNIPKQQQQVDDDEIYRASVLHSWDNINQKIKQNIFIKVQASKTQCYIGEAVLVTYKLYTRIESESKVADPPTFSGCSVVEMTLANASEQVELVNGRPFKTFVIRKVQLFPLQTGIIPLGIATVDNDLNLYQDSGNAYKVIQKQVQLASPPLSIKVLPLPLTKQQEDTTEVVGQFFLSAKVKKPIDTANDNNELEISISGKGNFMGITCPKIQFPSNVEAFEVENNDELDKTNFPVIGIRKFIIPFTCKQTGLTVIPALTFTYFDPEAKKYTTITTDTIQVNVVPPVAVNPDKDVITIEEPNHTPYILIVPAIAIVVATIMFIIFKRKKKTQDEPFTNEAYLIPTTPSEVSVEINTPEIDFSETETIVTPIFLPKKQLSALKTSEHNPSFFQDAKSLASQLIASIELNEVEKQELAAIIDYCNLALYTPIEANKHEVLVALERVVSNNF